jgi:arabinan endo-1,5-alpha-L-arabinosidase
MRRLVVGLVLLLVTAGCRPVQAPVAGAAATPSIEAPPVSGVVTPHAAQAGLPAAIDPQGSIKRIHDPVMAKEEDTYYVFSTGSRIAVMCSQDLVNWEPCYRIFDRLPGWVIKAVPGVGDLWAPDISYYDGKWQVYYSASTFGSRDSVIGLATNETLDPNSPNYAWVDEGEVLRTRNNDDWNAIDPNFVLDEEGQPWLAFGSFWSGIKLVKLDPATRKPAPGAEIISLASRRDSPDNTEAIEGAFIIRHGDYYYLFASFDTCCRGVDSTYNVRVGRSEKVTGPYVDRDGVPMLQGGGTQITGSYGNWRGPGHNGIFSANGIDWLVYHAYDADESGISKLRIEPIQWDDDGWPHVASYTGTE